MDQPSSGERSLTEGNVICHWYCTTQARWRDDIVDYNYCVNELHGTPQAPAPGRPAEIPPKQSY
jgi:hypothetical protein